MHIGNPAPGEPSATIRAIFHPRNRGKGAALRTGLHAATGDVLVVQDADLEYDPADWDQFWPLLANDIADVVYGSRFRGRPHRCLYYHHYLANKMISFLFSILHNQTLTYLEVCYKMFRRFVLDILTLRTDDFGFEIEFSANIAGPAPCASTRSASPTSAAPMPKARRSTGKTVSRPSITSSVFASIQDEGKMPTIALEPYSGPDVLEVLSEAENYNLYLRSLIDVHLSPGMKVVDFGAGAGTFALPLLQEGVDLVCIEPDAVLGARLRDAGANVVVGLHEIPDESIDFIYTLNVLEHIADDLTTVRALAAKLRSGGTLLIYVPAFQLLFSSFDRKIGHLRRYRRRGLASLVTAAGLRVTTLRYADSAGFLIALLYRLLRRADGNISLRAVQLYDRVVFPISKVMDLILSQSIGKNVLLVSQKP